MAKKAKDSGLGKDALFGTTTPPEEKKSKAVDRTKPDALKRRTYMLSNELFDRIAATADAHDVKQNELVRHLLTWSLDQIDEGKHELPVKTRNTLE